VPRCLTWNTSIPVYSIPYTRMIYGLLTDHVRLLTQTISGIVWVCPEIGSNIPPIHGQWSFIKKNDFLDEPETSVQNIWQCLMPVIDQVMIRYRKLYTFSSKNADQERPTSGTNCHEIHIGLLNFRGVIWQCVKTLYPWWTSK
jgi:hypothetical protein